MPFPSRSFWPGFIGSLVVCVATLSALAQSPSEPSRTRSASRQVPPFFGQIGLSIEQRESIYAIKARHLEKLAELEAEITKLKAAMLAECETVLTDVQKELLEHRRALDIDRRQAAKAKAAAKAPEPNPDSPAKAP